MPQLPGARALLILAAAWLSLAACTAGGFGTSGGTLGPGKDSPFAPGTDKSGDEVDPLIVGYRLSAAGEHELALKSFNRAAADRGLTTEIISAFASANLGLGRLGQAEELLRRATAANDATPEDWNNLGVVLMEKGETAEAVQILRKAFALDNGESASIRDNLRLALAKMENTAYAAPQEEQNYKLVRRGSSDFLIRSTPGI